MDLEIVKLLLDGGFAAVVIFMLYDLRKEQREMNRQIWALLDYLVRHDEALG